MPPRTDDSSDISHMPHFTCMLSDIFSINADSMNLLQLIYREELIQLFTDAALDLIKFNDRRGLQYYKGQMGFCRDFWASFSKLLKWYRYCRLIEFVIVMIHFILAKGRQPQSTMLCLILQKHRLAINDIHTFLNIYYIFIQTATCHYSHLPSFSQGAR